MAQCAGRRACVRACVRECACVCVSLCVCVCVQWLCDVAVRNSCWGGGGVMRWLVTVGDGCLVCSYCLEGHMVESGGATPHHTP